MIYRYKITFNLSIFEEWEIVKYFDGEIFIISKYYWKKIYLENGRVSNSIDSFKNWEIMEYDKDGELSSYNCGNDTM